MTNPVPAFKFHQGTTPLLVSMPHVGTHIPEALKASMTSEALRLPDTDWHLEALYDFLVDLGASVLIATHSRYVVDLNRPKDDQNLYPGQDTTGLFPVDTFHRDPVYLNQVRVDETEAKHRVSTYWVPYHNQLSQTLENLKETHGIALLWDAHSICSVVPRFFEGKLPDFNIGTANWTSCDPGLLERIKAIAEASPYTTAVNGRFKGGFITRHFGKPHDNIHAIQLELSQATYMQEAYPYAFDEMLANQVRPTLRAFLSEMLSWATKVK